MRRNLNLRVVRVHRLASAAMLVSLSTFLGCSAVAPLSARMGMRLNRAEIQPAVDAVYPALVRIQVVTEQGEGGRMIKSRASGSGTIISKEGHILTNHHVAGRATRIICRLADREEIEAELVGTDALTDLAVLKLNLASRRDPSKPVPCATFGNSAEVEVGDVVLAMGSPAGLSQSVTRGVVANTEMISPAGAGSFKLDGENVGELVRWIGHDAVIYPGNSGGPLVNLKGQIIGVNEVGIGSLGGAIPGNLAQSVARELIEHGHVSRSWIGLEVQPLLKAMTDAKGVLVATVLPDSPANAAGILAGDLITEYNGVTVVDARAPEDLPLFNRMMLSMPVGTPVTVRGFRGGAPMEWALTTIEREPVEAREMELLEWGLTVRDFTRVAALEMHRPERRGVLVDTVRAGGPGAEAKPGLRPGDVITMVNGVEASNVLALNEWTRNFTKDLLEPKPVLVAFERNLEHLVTVPKIGPEVELDKPLRPAKGWLGAETQVLTRDVAQALNLEGSKGVRVTQIMPDSPAQAAGLKEGDILLKLDGQVIAASTPSDDELFDNLIRQYKVGGEVELQGIRAGAPLKLTATLGKTPKPASDLAEYKDELFEFTAREMSLGDRVNERLQPSEQGVKITSVSAGGWAALAGMGTGDVLFSVGAQPIDSIDALRNVMKDITHRKPARVKIFIKRGIYTAFLELEPKW
jgi:serine protease Do